jgi:hypothetical protein
MTSAAKIAANRRNAQRSTGPRSAAGKARTRYNALQHGLNIPARYDPATGAQIQELAVYLSADAVAPREQDLAMRAAEAQFDLLRVQCAKVDLVNGFAKRLGNTDASLSEGERLALGFMRKSKTLGAFGRYERRATSSRNRSLRKLRALQELHRRQRAVEEVGPPRPKEHVTVVPFVENVRRLEIHRVVEAAIDGVRWESGGHSPICQIVWRWGPAEEPTARISVALRLSGDVGLLLLVFIINGQQVSQTFTLLRIRTRVGGGRWLVRCPETDKLVQDLYLDAKQKRFCSRHALKLRYRSKTMLAWERHWERCQKLMDRIGATDYRDLPPRPKHMHRATYHWVCEEIFTEVMRMHLALRPALAGEIGITLDDLR